MGKDEKTRIGIIGSRFAAGLHMDAYRRLDNVEVVAVAAIDNLDPFGDRHGIKDRYEDYHRLLERKDVELVSITTPNYIHKEMVLAAAKAGKNIICEKPMATTVPDAEEMVKACRDEDVRLYYAEDWCFAPAIRRAREIVKEGAIGDILYVKAKETHSGSHSIYAQRADYCGGGAMIHLGVHPIGFVRWLLEKKVVSVVAMTSGGEEGNLFHTGYTGEDWSAAILEFENRAFGLVEGNYVTFGGIDDVVEIYGTKGNLRVNLTQGSPISVYSQVGYSYSIEKTDTNIGWTKPAVDEEWQLGYPSEIAYFVRCHREDKRPAFGTRGEDGLEALRIVSAIYESAKTGRRVQIVRG